MAFSFFTFGGLFCWQDKYAFGGWRLQENIWSHRCRILDPYDICRFSGKLGACKKRLNNFIRAWRVTSTGKAVVLLPGFFQNRRMFRFLEKRLVTAGFETIFFSSPTRFSTVKQKASALNKLLNHRPDIKEIHFAAFGFGGLVLRQACAMPSTWSERVKRAVMIAVPNKGLSWTKERQNNKIYRFLLGNMAPCLFPEAVEKIPFLTCDFATIVGGTGEKHGLLPFIKEDNDGILPTKDAKHPKAKAEYLIPDAPHFSLLKNEKLLDICTQFLSEGYSNRQRNHGISNIWNES